MDNQKEMLKHLMNTTENQSLNIQQGRAETLSRHKEILEKLAAANLLVSSVDRMDETNSMELSQHREWIG
jgi:hypothetical protein